MPCDSYVDVIFAIGRVAVLILGILSGTFCIFLGWRLYRENINSATSGELKYNTARLVFKALGPGVFLALFGAVIVWTIVSQKVDLSTSTPTPKASSLTPTTTQPAPFRSGALISVADGRQVPRIPQLSTTPPCEPCIVARKTRVYQSGEPPLTAEEYEQALEAATVLLSISLNSKGREEGREEERVKLRTHIHALQTLSAGLIK